MRCWWLCATMLCVLLAPQAVRAEERTPPFIPAPILLLTLDDRPPNVLLVQQLAAIAGVTLEITTDPARAPEADLVSLNTVAAGSLVASRSSSPAGLAAPSLRRDALVHFAVPRAQPLVKDQETLAKYTSAVQQLAKEEVQWQIVGMLEAKRPGPSDPALQDYAERLRAWLAYVRDCKLPRDRLLITLDDNRPGPLAAWLKVQLRKIASHVHDGTDEGMMLLLARKLREIQRPLTGGDRLKPREIAICWTDAEGLLVTRPFESALPLENVVRMADWLHLAIVSDVARLPAWQPALWIHTARGEEPEQRERIAAQLAKIGEHPVIVADIAKLNGGDPVLINTWREAGIPPGTVGYLGWNTASNTLGSAMALWTAIDFGYAMRADPTTVRGGIELFLWSRLLDDYLYQTVVRATEQPRLQGEGLNIWALPPEVVQSEAEALQFALIEAWHDHAQFNTVFAEILPLDQTRFGLTLPWGRMFEIGLVPVDPRGFLPVVSAASVDPAPR